MFFVVLAIPLSLLCFYLAFLAWRRRFRRHAMVLAAVGVVFLGAVLIASAVVWYGYNHLEMHHSRTPPSRSS